MLPVHTILHPTDFSEQSHHALCLACSLARDYNARLILLHVAARPVLAYGEGVFVSDSDELRLEASEKLNHIEPGPQIRAERRVEEGDPIDEILHFAAENHVDLIVMGTHGRTGLRRLLMGSVAEQVVRKAPCPVLTVKTPFPAEPVEAGPPREEPANA
jgi:nucleotide-binding universal stress UspA family protein